MGKWAEFHFDRCWPYIEAAIERMKEPYGRDFVWGRIKDGSAQLWPGDNSVVVTEIENNPDGTKEIYGWIAGGEWDELNKIQNIAAEWGKLQGCTTAKTVQRPGFLRKPFDGFRLKAVIMEKEL